MLKNFDESIVLVRSTLNDNIGTAFVIHTNAEKDITYLLTCLHVVNDGGGLEKLQVHGQCVADVKFDKTSGSAIDLAILRVDKNLGLPELSLSRHAEEGDKVFVQGCRPLHAVQGKKVLFPQVDCQLGKQTKLGALENASLARVPIWQLLVTNKDDKFWRGFSGSPVRNKESMAVVGVLSFRDNTQGFAISAEVFPRLWQEEIPFDPFIEESITGRVLLMCAPDDLEDIKNFAQQLNADGIQTLVNDRTLTNDEQNPIDWQTCHCFALFIGNSGEESWRNLRVEQAITDRLRIDPAFRVVPVMLPGGERDERSKLPRFLVNARWLELSPGLGKEANEKLRNAVTSADWDLPNAILTDPKGSMQSPYRGLHSFEEKHADLFFGREALTDWLVDALRHRLSGKRPRRFLVVEGPSGSGKSSLVKAGLIPALRHGVIEGSSHWLIALFRPLTNPIGNLALEVGNVLGKSDATTVIDLDRQMRNSEKALHLTIMMEMKNHPAPQLLLVIDQFEEIFTSCDSEDERRSMIENLMFATRISEGRLTVVLAMRADFRGLAAGYSEFDAVLSDSSFLVGPMNDVELNRAVKYPAQLFKHEVDPELVRHLVAQVREIPGRLPLMQDVLTEMWDRRNGAGVLSLDLYETIGGIEGALAKRAENVYRGLSSQEKLYCRSLFLKLVSSGIGSHDTRRRVKVEELMNIDRENQNLLEDILKQISSVEARLISMGHDNQENERYAEIIHEALIRAWPRLSNWIGEEDENLRIYQDLIQATKDWEESGRKNSFLHVGARLIQALEWVETHPKSLDKTMEEFLEASREQYAQERRLSDAATLDQLESSAASIWFDMTAMRNWLMRAEHLLNGLEEHQKHLKQMSHCELSLEGRFRLDDQQHHLRYDTLQVLINRLKRAEQGIISATRHIVETQPKLALKQADGSWETAILDIRNHSPLYHGLKIAPQDGLIPLRCDPHSQLWEFLHLLTGKPPQVDASGRYIVDEAMGVVLVLIPPGSFIMGAAETAVGMDDNIDPHARLEEAPCHRVKLDTFFISKYPMTQAQWLRATGTNPSFFAPGQVELPSGLTHPVECVSWKDCQSLTNIGLQLPTEAQWERAARGGTKTIWWSGDDRDILRNKVNIQGYRDTGHDLPATSPVGSYCQANPFGLYDVVGNVWEWCQDRYCDYTALTADGDGQRMGSSDGGRVCRGGSFFNTIDYGRSAVRYFHVPEQARFTNLGMRPARRLEQR